MKKLPGSRTRRLATVPLAVALALSAAAGTAAVAGASQTRSPSAFIIVIDTGVTGGYAANGQAAVAGVKAAAAVLNKSGGILGHRVEVDVLDDQGNPATAAGLLEGRLSSGQKPNLIEPGSISPEGVVEVPIATAAKIISIGTPNASSLNNPAKYPYEFLIAPSAILPEYGLMSYYKAHHVSRFAMISSTDAYGASVEAAVAQAAKQANITLYDATYNDTDLSVTGQLEKLRADKPQALFVQAFGAPVGVILQDRHTIGWKIPTIGDLTTATTPLTGQLAGTAEEKNFQLQVLRLCEYSKTQSKATSAFIAALKVQGAIKTVLITSSYQYDSVMVIAQAAKQAGSIKTSAMLKAMLHLRQPTKPPWVTLKTYVFTSKDHAPAASPKNWIIVPSTHLVDGQYGAPGA